MDVVNIIAVFGFAITCFSLGYMLGRNSEKNNRHSSS